MVANDGAKRLQRHARELSDATWEKKEKTTKKSPMKLRKGGKKLRQSCQDYGL